MQQERYARSQIVMHWLMAALVLGMVGLGWFMTSLPKGPDRSWYFALHKSLGLTAALLVLLRIVLRRRHGAPALPDGVMSPLQAKAAHLAHGLLYVCLVAMPVSGYLSSSFTKYPMKFFGLVLPKWGWEDEFLNKLFNGLHVATSYLLVAVVLVHVAAALSHVLKGEGTLLRRMSPF